MNQSNLKKGQMALAGAALAALLAAGCGGSNSGVRLPGGINTGAPTDAAAKGAWSEVNDWPLVPIHVLLLPDGRVLSYGTTTPVGGGDTIISGGLHYDLWNPDPAPRETAHLTLENFTATDIFCNAQLVLPQPDAGALLIGGDTFPRREPDPPPPPDPADPDAEIEIPEDNDSGNADSVVLDYAGDNTLTSGPTMNRARWYATATTLTNGEVYVQGGRAHVSSGLISGTDLPEIRGLDGTFRLLTGADTSTLRYYYPRNFVMPDATLFGFDPRGNMYRVDPSGSGSITLLDRFAALYRGDDSTAAMFRIGRILQFGGTTVDNSVASDSVIIDANMPVPVLTPSGNLSSLRRLSTATILPTGQVLATGGSTFYNELRGVNLAAEIWDPVSGVWTLGAAASLPRLYHSSALLLADGRVMVGGGGVPGPLILPNVEFYSPPYLFDASGRAARRPLINSVSDTLEVARNFTLGYGDVAGSSGASRVVLLRTGSASHNWNMEQRFIELPFSVINTSTLNVRMPSRVGEVPPGYYMIFAINQAGVPSAGRFVFINLAPAADAAQDPVIAAPANRAGATGVFEDFTVSAGDPDSAALSFVAAGLPPGISIARLDAFTARVSGSPTAAGSYDVVVTASDGVRTANTNFVWTVAP